MTEDELAKQLKQFQELAANNKEVDIASLSLQALQGYQKNMIDPKEKRWAYLVSLAAPPFGLIFAAKFYFSRKDDGLAAATGCVVLTFVSVLAFALIMKTMFVSSGVTPAQLQQAPQQLQQLTQ